MSKLGLSFLIANVFGVDGVKISNHYGKTIVSAALKPDTVAPDWDKTESSEYSKEVDCLLLKFADGTAIRLYDDAQSCCEHRYISTDDDVADLVGQKLIEVECRDIEKPEDEDEDGNADIDNYCHDMMFVKIQGNKSPITLCTHNEHNGYYGGFILRCDELKLESELEPN